MRDLTVTSILPMYYESSGTGVPIVFIHPPHMDHAVFRYQRQLAEHFRVILYDIRGHGRSGIDAEPLTIPTLAADLLTLLDELNIDRAVPCGYSSGGSVAQEFALAYPERTKALILSGGFPKVNTFLLKNEFRAGMALVKAGKQRFLSKVLSFSHRITNEDRHELFKHCIKADELTAYRFYRESLHYDCTDRLHELSMPLLLLNGSRSVYMHPYIKYYLQRVKRVQSVFVSNITHQLPTKGYLPFNHAIKQFVRSLEE
ncbi:MAG TPA: alpha/beta hydrolase [Bacillales bacterium]|nr:alpha/beta hydrolase [Bacillales bacterium]